MSHTPGPWVAAMGQFDYGNDGSRRVMFGDANGDTYGRIASVDTKAPRVLRGKNATAYSAPDAERDANARLIAAAPDLLEALEELVDVLPCQNGCKPDDMTCATMRARAIIKKARGK